MDPAPNASLLRMLPQVEKVMREQALANVPGVPREAVANAVRAEIDARRQLIMNGESPDTTTEAIAKAALVRACALATQSLRRVVNASGVIIHTNLGRSALAEEAIAAVNDVIVGYSTLEYDRTAMARGSRHAHCEALICELTGAEAAIAVNNNAAAVFMVLSTFAAGREAIVSRGEQVEIGGAVRLPDIMRESNARMVEVGTTNKTHLADYERALSGDTAMVLKVHPSNYRMTGFVESVPVRELRKMVDEHCTKAGNRVLVYEDQGSGAFLRLEAFGDSAEPVVAEPLAAGADLVSFSGDKLLGGPQAGIIAGRADLIEQLKASPLARVLRVDKMNLAALEATLRLYLNPERAMERIPTVRMLVESPDRVRARAQELLEAVAARIPAGAAELSVVPETARAGGGALPMCDIPSFGLRVQFTSGNALACDRFLVQQSPVTVVARLHDDELHFDARTILGHDEIVAIAVGLALYFDQLE